MRFCSRIDPQGDAADTAYLYSVGAVGSPHVRHTPEDYRHRKLARARGRRAAGCRECAEAYEVEGTP